MLETSLCMIMCIPPQSCIKFCLFMAHDLGSMLIDLESACVFQQCLCRGLIKPPSHPQTQKVMLLTWAYSRPDAARLLTAPTRGLWWVCAQTFHFQWCSSSFHTNGAQSCVSASGTHMKEDTLSFQYCYWGLWSPENLIKVHSVTQLESAATRKQICVWQLRSYRKLMGIVRWPVI